MGDLPGHPFRGNQWTTNVGGKDLTITRGEKIRNFGGWYQHDVVTYKGQEIGRIQTRRRSGRVDTLTIAKGGSGVLGTDLDWLARQASEPVRPVEPVREQGLPDGYAIRQAAKERQAAAGTSLSRGDYLGPAREGGASAANFQSRNAAEHERGHALGFKAGKEILERRHMPLYEKNLGDLERAARKRGSGGFDKGYAKGYREAWKRNKSE